jgi:hypothetical protein
MGVNRYLPHVYVLPEDDANRQLALGFQLSLDPFMLRRMQVLPVAGGWLRVLEGFLSDLVVTMGRHPGGFAVLLIDFDGDAGRLGLAKNRIPGSLTERVFILGALTKPEELKSRFGLTYSEIGSKIAQECRDGSDTIWEQELLRHNAGELARLRECVRSILFS